MHEDNSWSLVSLSLVADGETLPDPGLGCAETGCGCRRREGHEIVRDATRSAIAKRSSSLKGKVACRRLRFLYCDKTSQSDEKIQYTS